MNLNNVDCSQHLFLKSSHTMSETLSPTRTLAERIDRENAITLTEMSPNPASWERTSCRACLSNDLIEVLNLGNQPPANSFVKLADLGQTEARYPLSLRLCEACGMVQLGHVVPPELLYRSYLFFTSSSQWMADHFSKLMTDNAAEFVPPGGLVVEIGSNDGTALSAIHRRDVRLLGIDPARNISVMAASRGVPTIAEFFNETLAAEVARVAGQAHRRLQRDGPHQRSRPSLRRDQAAVGTGRRVRH